MKVILIKKWPLHGRFVLREVKGKGSINRPEESGREIRAIILDERPQTGVGSRT